MTTDEENISSVSHTTTTPGEPVYWKSILLQAVGQKQLSDLVRNAIKDAKGNACPFCSSALGSKSTRNRHMKDSCQVLQSNQSRIRATRGVVTYSPCPTSSSEIQHQKHRSVIVQSSRYEASQTQGLQSRQSIKPLHSPFLYVLLNYSMLLKKYKYKFYIVA